MTADTLTARRASNAASERPLLSAVTTHALALADQAIVSGTSFLAMVLVGRWVSASELGAYAIGISLIVSLVYIQDSLISLPYTVQRVRRPQSVDSSAEHAGGCLAFSVLLSIPVVIALGSAALITAAFGVSPELTLMLGTLAAIAPFAMLRDFARGFAFAHLRVTHALVLDATVAAIQLGIIFWLGLTGRMSAAAACGALGIACSLVSIGWFSLARGGFAFEMNQIRAVMRESWRLGRWLFAVQIAATAQRYAVFWLLPFAIGMTATGVFAACMSIAMLANPVILALANIRTARAVEALRSSGGMRLRRQTVQDALLLGGMLTVFCLVLFFVGNDIMRLLYPQKQFEEHGYTLTIVAVALLATAVGAPASTALTSMERPRAILWSSLIGASLTVVLTVILAGEWGLTGAAYGFLAGSIAATIARWIPFWSAVSGNGLAKFQAGASPTSATRPIINLCFRNRQLRKEDR